MRLTSDFSLIFSFPFLLRHSSSSLQSMDVKNWEIKSWNPISRNSELFSTFEIWLTTWIWYNKKCIMKRNYWIYVLRIWNRNVHLSSIMIYFIIMFNLWLKLKWSKIMWHIIILLKLYSLFRQCSQQFHGALLSNLLGT